ncbi:MAG: thioredoxin family protein [Candidatus Lernaella stagnicola]|nr:thioredoxin family protein [Candidatus Lernaella stagnicola]
MKKVFWNAMFIVAAAAVTLLAWNLQPRTAHAGEDAAKVGASAPDFTLPDQNGKAHKLSDYQGKIVVLEWTNADCPFVKRHYKADTMEKLAAKYQGNDVIWLAVNSSHFINAEEAKTWQQSQGLDYPILLDPDGRVGQTYRARTTPHLFVVDASGTLVYDGAIDDSPHGMMGPDVNYVANAVDSLLAGQPVSPSKTRPYGCSVKYK